MTRGRLSESAALAMPKYGPDEADSRTALAEVLSGARSVEVRIGVGPTVGIPARVLPYAGALNRMIGNDLPKLFGPKADVAIHIFSSAPKSGEALQMPPLQSLTALAGGLRVAGCMRPITIEVADAAPEVPSDLEIPLRRSLADWLEGRARHHGAPDADLFSYGVEHAAESMFGDLSPSLSAPPFRLTLGGATEGPFFVLRCRVREAARRAGLRVAPCGALILRALRRPWYYATDLEPPLSLMAQPAVAIQALEDAANPARGGNAGLKAEARGLARFAGRPGLDELIEAVSTPKQAHAYAQALGVTLGPRLKANLEDSV